MEYLTVVGLAVLMSAMISAVFFAAKKQSEERILSSDNMMLSRDLFVYKEILVRLVYYLARREDEARQNDDSALEQTIFDIRTRITEIEAEVNRLVREA